MTNSVASETEPKSAKGKRQISPSDFVGDALREHRKRRLTEGNAGSTYVFCDSVGGPLIKANLNLSFQRLVKRAGVPRIRFHHMRHTNATMLLKGGVHPKAVQERLGHSPVSMTLDVYSHVIESVDRDAAAKIDAMLARPAAAAVG